MLSIRRASWDDRQLLWDWVNDPEVRKASFEENEVDWKTHLQWFEDRLRRKDSFIYILTINDGSPVAQVRFDLQENGDAEVDITVAPELRCKGYGTAALLIATTKIFNDSLAMKLIANIKATNKSSLRVFTKAGFTRREKVDFQGVETVRMVRERPKELLPN